MSKEEIIQKIYAETMNKSPDFTLIKSLLIKWYFEENGKVVCSLDLLTREQLDEVVRWIDGKEISQELNLYKGESILKRVFHGCLSSKINYLSQAHCPFCTQEFPITIMYLRIRPQSYQALTPDLKKAFKAAIRQRMLQEKSEYKKCKVCLHIVFVCSQNRSEKDLDNMSKILLDSIKDLIMDDDSEVDHLSVMKVKNPDSEEYITINIRKSNLNLNHDQLSPFLHHSWAGATMIELEDFL